ncbi:SRPBCC domain-containing protein [Pedobacter nototheniae]|uniref:SRPBCC domain-containing protein n=1 Tax=Pedobacter nototheniae TaxID=2488994 RepID=UPI00293183E7|nr:SRPBCC domain-containing protein [Pedobacter nototheniae]
MPTEIETDILINATPEKIWNILIDFNEYPNWNPFIKLIEGTVKTGQKIKVEIAPPGAKKMIFKPKVLAFETNKRFSWIGHLLFTGLFDGEHQFELIDHGNGTTTFKQSEKFKGILVPLFKSQLHNNTTNGFNLMNEKLKEMAEK